MKILTRSIICLGLVAAAVVSHAAGARPFLFPRSTPEAQGVSPSAVLALIEAISSMR
jgi:hypothetical protein